jgi:methionyl-tRNA synthetase
VLAFVDAGLRDFSVSRSIERAHGWGIPVPGDGGQVIYVWFDALANYISALGAPTGSAYARWWCGNSERVHVIGKGITRFHAVYWPAILRSAELPWPTAIFVHDYVTVDGAKIGKSLGNTVDPVALANAVGADALRWWLLREVPRAGDADFTCERLVATANRDLANGVGNFVRRVRGLAQGVDVGDGPVDPAAASLLAATSEVPVAIDAGLRRFDFRRALDALLRVVAEGNRYLDATRPWESTNGREAVSHTVFRPLVAAVGVLGRELGPFVPDISARIRAGGDEPVFRRVESAQVA